MLTFGYQCCFHVHMILDRSAPLCSLVPYGLMGDLTVSGVHLGSSARNTKTCGYFQKFKEK